ncbi:Zinc transporter 6 [Strongyloides ratti]|uniref:Zinc transporter 6 n=1 Tax=Strongyloides ratti TaxID=34506 RepID=A0A090L4U7_STRRB|nr:Zinc transporter 6 [Strongyloides ratti]CEF64821.1 Zinc transporter 6 [Strongyloides ratti]
MLSEVNSRIKTGGGICLLLTIISCYLTSQADSLILSGASWLNIFAFFAIFSSITTSKTWSKRNSHYTYGYTRAPVMAVFATSLLAQLFSVFLIKESFEHLLGGHGNSINHQEHHEDHEDHNSNGHLDHEGKSFYFFCSIIITSISLLVSSYTVIGQPFHHVLQVSSASSLQEHAADISQAICYVVPGLSRLLLPRINSMILLIFVNGFCSLFTLFFGHDFEWCDSVATIALSVGVFSTTMPLSSYTGKILLQTTSPHILNQIDRCISEASTVEGVLELKSAQFWLLDFSQIAGSVDVRVRRDANDQMVLALVTEKLNNIINILTVEIVKDSSTSWGSMYQSSSPEFCEANAGDVLYVECSQIGFYDINNVYFGENNDLINWKFIKGEVKNVSHTFDKEKSVLKIKIPFTSLVTNLEISCYGNKEIFHSDSVDYITIKINHDDMKIRRKEALVKKEMKTKIFKLFILGCVVLSFDIITGLVFLMICIKFLRLKKKEARKQVLRKLILEAEKTLSEIELANTKKNQKPSSQPEKANKLSGNLITKEDKNSKN